MFLYVVDALNGFSIFMIFYKKKTNDWTATLAEVTLSKNLDFAMFSSPDDPGSARFSCAFAAQSDPESPQQ